MKFESINYKKYKKNHGRENQFFITSYVGISLIKSTDDKPEDLSTSWNPKSIDSTKIESKFFIQKSSLVYSISAFEAYLSDFILDQVLPLQSEPVSNLSEVYSGKSLFRKIEVLIEHFPDLKNKEYFLFIVSIFWRNKLIHNSKESLSGALKGELRKYSQDFLISYCNLDIEKLINHYEAHDVPTFKETLSMMTNLRNFASKIDEFFTSNLSIDKYIAHNITKLINIGKIKKFDLSSNRDNKTRFWTNIFEIHLRLNVNDDVKRLDIWNDLMLAENREKVEHILGNILN